MKAKADAGSTTPKPTSNNRLFLHVGYTTELYRNTSKWKYDNGRIILYNLYENDDREFKDDYDFNCALEILDVTLERSFGRVVFRYENGKYLYYKLWF